MTTIDLTFMKSIRDDLDAALATLAKKHGVAISVGSGTYAKDGSNASFKIQIAGGGAQPGDSVRRAKQAADLKRYAPAFPDINFNATYKHPKIVGAGKIVGYNPRGRETPFIVEFPSGHYRMSESNIKAMSKV